MVMSLASENLVMGLQKWPVYATRVPPVKRALGSGQIYQTWSMPASCFHLILPCPITMQYFEELTEDCTSNKIACAIAHIQDQPLAES